MALRLKRAKTGSLQPSDVDDRTSKSVVDRQLGYERQSNTLVFNDNGDLRRFPADLDLSTKQDKLTTANGNQYLMTSPDTAGGQPGSLPRVTFVNVGDTQTISGLKTFNQHPTVVAKSNPVYPTLPASNKYATEAQALWTISQAYGAVSSSISAGVSLSSLVFLTVGSAAAATTATLGFRNDSGATIARYSWVTLQPYNGGVQGISGTGSNLADGGSVSIDTDVGYSASSYNSGFIMIQYNTSNTPEYYEYSVYMSNISSLKYIITRAKRIN